MELYRRPCDILARVEKNVHLLSLVTPTPIITDMTEQMMAVLSAATESGIFDAAIREWDHKPEHEKTWDKVKIFISEEFCQKRGQLTARQAGFGSADSMQEAITDVMKDQANLATNVVDALKEMKLTIAELQKKINEPASKTTQPAATPSATGGGGKSYAEKRAERKQRFLDAPTCKNCNGKHPTVEESKCWELDANSTSRPTGWKSRKTTPLIDGVWGLQ